MSFVASIAERSVVVFGLILVCLQMLAHEAGFWLGRRDKTRHDRSAETVGVVMGGMLGLLGFTLALTLSFANARFDERRTGSLAEANAIGTAWLRAKAIGGQPAERIADLLDQYTKVRSDFVLTGRDQVAIDALNQHTDALQSEIWDNLTEIVRERPDPVSASLMAALNETFDMSATERFAFALRLPAQLFWLLVAMTLLCMASLGYQFGLKERAPRVLVTLFSLMLAAVIVDVLDLASGRLGYFRAGTAIYEQTLQSFKRSLPAPG